MKPSLTWDQQAGLVLQRGLIIDDHTERIAFLEAHTYYRFSGYGRYIQQAPDQGDDTFLAGTAFCTIREIHQVLPVDKHRKVADLQARGHRVAVVGDGVNDARPWPAPTSASPSAPAPTWPSNRLVWCSLPRSARS